MEDLLTNFTADEIVWGLLFCVFLALAVKGFISFADWVVDRVRSMFDKEYAEKSDKKKVESDIQSLRDEEQKINERLTHFQEEDNQILGELAAIRRTLDEHIRVSDDRNADAARAYILRFNMEVVRKLKHTSEDFAEVLAKIDEYEDYCRKHEDYRNNRAVAAIENVKRVYAERLRDNDFL